MGTGKYLGLPSMIGRDKRYVFSFIKDRIWKRINAWRGRALSKAGKKVMIKSVLQSIPSCIMSIYLLPKFINVNRSSREQLDTKLILKAYNVLIPEQQHLIELFY